MLHRRVVARVFPLKLFIIFAAAGAVVSCKTSNNKMSEGAEGSNSEGFVVDESYVRTDDGYEACGKGCDDGFYPLRSFEDSKCQGSDYRIKTHCRFIKDVETMEVCGIKCPEGYYPLRNPAIGMKACDAGFNGYRISCAKPSEITMQLCGGCPRGYLPSEQKQDSRCSFFPGMTLSTCDKH